MAIWDKIIASPDKDKKKAQELWERATKYFDGKLYNRALKDLGEALMLDNSLAKEAVELMMMFNSQGADEQALSVGLALLKMNPNDSDLMNKLGNTLRNLGSFDKAKNLYTRILKAQPTHTEAKYNLAACSFRIKTADSSLVSQTRKAEGLISVRRYAFEGAREDYVPVPNQELEEEKKPKDKEKEKHADLSEEELAQVREAQINELKLDVAGNQQSWEANFNLALLYDLFGMGELSIQHYRTAVEVDPENRKSNNNLAVALMEHQKNNQEAEAILLKNLGHHSYDRTTVQNLAILYRRTGKAFQTLKYFVYLGDLLSKSLWKFETEGVEELARQYYERRKYLEAVPMFENLALEKKDPFWLEKLSVMYFNQKKEDEYIHSLKRLIKLDPTQTDAVTKLTGLAGDYEKQAREKYEKKSRNQAIGLMVKAVKIEETPERWVDLAQWYEEDGEEILAENALRRWKRMVGEPGGEEASAETPGSSLV
ncbi:MAG: tetratricopeptide repeat protein [Deltaproteobacteria bacterium]|nr:tetratricopeptide repeat protein [Deltaproteobacteria bacterium]